MNWFSAHGDKLLAGIAATAAALGQAGITDANTVGAVTGIAAILHTIFWPNNTPSAKQ